MRRQPAHVPDGTILDATIRLSKNLAEDGGCQKAAGYEAGVVVADGTQDVAVEGYEGKQPQQNPQPVPVAGQWNEQQQCQRPDVQQATQTVLCKDQRTRCQTQQSLPRPPVLHEKDRPPQLIFDVVKAARPHS